MNNLLICKGISKNSCSFLAFLLFTFILMSWLLIINFPISVPLLMVLISKRRNMVIIMVTVNMVNTMVMVNVMAMDTAMENIR